MTYDERTVVTIISRVSLRELRLWVREGWVRPSHGEAGPVFDEVDIARIRLLCDLTKDMAVPSNTLPVVLNLLDSLHQARRELRCLSEALEKQPDAVRRSVVDTYRRLQDAREIIANGD